MINNKKRENKLPKKKEDKLILHSSLTLEEDLTTGDDLEFISAQAHLLDSIFY